MIAPSHLRALVLAALCCAPMMRSVAADADGAACTGYLTPMLAAATSATPSFQKNSNGLKLTDDVTYSADGYDGNWLVGQSVLTGNVDVHMGDRELQADKLTHDANDNTMSALGQVRFRNPIVMVQGDTGHYADDGALFTHAQFQFQKQSGYGSADQFVWTPNNVINVQNVIYTSCPPPHADWRIRAKQLRLDTAAGEGVGRDARLEVEGIPILYLPWISFPLNDARKSGFLFPEFSTSSPNGITVSTPWYWNIAPNQDATITPTLYALRGLDTGVQYRFLSESDSGTFNGNFLPDDQRQQEQNRSHVRLVDRLNLAANTRLDVNFESVSDVQYFEDFTQGTEATSTPFLPRSLLISHRDDIWNLRAQVLGYQTLDTVNLIEYERPYEELPRINASALWSPDPLQILNLSFDSEVVDFTRSCDPFSISSTLMQSQLASSLAENCPPGSSTTTCRRCDAVAGGSAKSTCLPCSATGPANGVIVDPEFPLGAGVSGWRLHARPQVGLDVSGPGYFLRPSVAWDFTQYELRDANLVVTSPETGQPALATAPNTSPQRSLPIVDIDSGLQFERMTAGDARTVTFEPRMMYVYIPYRDQSQLPVFDTSTPDLNTIELFQPNRFVGIDRIGDSNSLTVGATTQWFDNASGSRYLSATLAQALYLQQPLVTAPDQTQQPRTTSSIIGEVNLTAYRHWNVQADVASSPTVSRILQAEVMLQYLSNSKQVANIGYLYRDGVLQQVDGSAAWPISSHWDVYARAVYSLFGAPATGTTPAAHPGSIEDFAGFQYRGSCWSVRAIAQHSISTRTGQSDTGVSFQVELTGLSNVGNGVGTGCGVNTFLEQSIRGYSASANKP